MTAGVEFEHRAVREPLTLREQGGVLLFSGVACVPGIFYDVAGLFEEKITTAAIRGALAENPDVALNLQHGRVGSGWPLARTRSTASGATPTLRLGAGAHGLMVEADLDPADEDTQLMVRKVNAGLVGAMSFAFRILDESWSKDGSRRTISALSIDGGDVTVCVAGANPAAEVLSVRARELRAAAIAGRQVRPDGDLPDHTSRARQRLAVLRAGRR
jgi:HK97 family phage prohead protease